MPLSVQKDYHMNTGIGDFYYCTQQSKQPMKCVRLFYHVAVINAF